ncbi:hypothetical protein TrispH2_004363 [Trichoplax sp. H2]|nr:hypothetical protein TrispH2_004363 [Trichoplax sp. H2]|eukprot:RDD44516.1 hypothetical protein TrispH2_004363 [Trichoplax sp. H2]
MSNSLLILESQLISIFLPVISTSLPQGKGIPSVNMHRYTPRAKQQNNQDKVIESTNFTAISKNGYQTDESMTNFSHKLNRIQAVIDRCCFTITVPIFIAFSSLLAIVGAFLTEIAFLIIMQILALAYSLIELVVMLHFKILFCWQWRKRLSRQSLGYKQNTQDS